MRGAVEIFSTASMLVTGGGGFAMDFTTSAFFLGGSDLVTAFFTGSGFFVLDGSVFLVRALGVGFLEAEYNREMLMPGCTQCS